MKTQISLKLSKDILEKLDDRAIIEHRTRTNLVESIIIDYLGTRNYWLGVAMKDGISEDFKSGDEFDWDGCDPRAKRGDKGFIYITNPSKYVKYLIEVAEDAKEDEILTKHGEKMGFRCRYRVLYNFENPLTITEMRNFESLKEWYPLKVRFIRMIFKIEEKHWLILRDILITKNPNSKDYF
jgi:hypothetical protein